MNILVIGENCVDKFIYCTIDRLSPEAPVPVLTPIKTVENPGMAGNTKANLKALDPNCYVVSLTQKAPITKTRYVEEKSNHMFLRVDEGEDFNCHFKWGMGTDVIIGQADIVIISDYDKGWLRDGDLREIARKSKLSILDSKRKLTNELIQDFTFIKLNESERLNNPYLDRDNIITTLGSRGAEYQGIVYPSPNPQQTIDVSGAGDTFTAAFILKYFETKDEKVSIKFANEMAARVVSKRGIVTP